ncbi:hypothetical protein SMMN14_08732 [Sphaerulina musiva]
MLLGMGVGGGVGVGVMGVMGVVGVVGIRQVLLSFNVHRSTLQTQATPPTINIYRLRAHIHSFNCSAVQQPDHSLRTIDLKRKQQPAQIQTLHAGTTASNHIGIPERRLAASPTIVPAA